MPCDLREATTPDAVLAADQQTAFLLMCTVWSVVALTCTLVGALAGAPVLGLGLGLELGLGLGLGLSVIAVRTAWVSFVITRGGWRCVRLCRGPFP